MNRGAVALVAALLFGQGCSCAGKTPASLDGEISGPAEGSAEAASDDESLGVGSKPGPGAKQSNELDWQSDPCREYVGCEAYGACTTDGPICRATRLADCQASWACQAYGYCALGPEHCVLGGAGQVDCSSLGTEAYDACKTLGRCELRDGLCVATSDAHCKDTSSCKDGGACRAIDGACELPAASDADCLASDQCTWSGRCHAVDGRCKTTRDEDCAQAALCGSDGLCTHYKGQCVATEETHCRASRECELSGRCNLGGGTCYATADDCKKLDACAVEPCKVVRGECDMKTPFIYFQF